MYIISCYGRGHDQVEVRALERGGLGEALPEMGDEVHDAPGTGAEEGDGELGFVHGQAHQLEGGWGRGWGGGRSRAGRRSR